MNFDESIELSLRTWYPEDHPLHFNPHHPLGKLIGELGELLDDYMKSLYKPGYEFEPLDELGDIWYYLRILAYQNKYKLTARGNLSDIDTEYIIVDCLSELAVWFTRQDAYTFKLFLMNKTFASIIEIGKRYNITIDQLTESNWQKLKPGSERGDEWAKARVGADDTR